MEKEYISPRHKKAASASSPSMLMLTVEGRQYSGSPLTSYVRPLIASKNFAFKAFPVEWHGIIEHSR